MVGVNCIVTDKFIIKRIGIGTKRTLEEALKECNIKFDDEILENLVNEKIESQIGLSMTVSLFVGAKELLEQFQGRIKIALATMSSQKIIDKLLLEKNIDTYFDFVVTADEVSKPKPDPEIFLISAEKLDVNPEDCLVIEDSVFGVRAAKKAKMKCIAVLSGAYSRRELHKENPDLIVEDLTEKERILHFIFRNKN